MGGEMKRVGYGGENGKGREEGEGRGWERGTVRKRGEGGEGRGGEGEGVGMENVSPHFLKRGYASGYNRLWHG
jgi:hypothetical protein